MSEYPSDWEVTHLGAYLKETKERVHEGTATPYSVSKVLGIVPQSEKFKKRVASNDISNYKIIREGDFAYDPMLLWDGSINRMLREDTGAVSPAYVTFRVLDNSLDADYLLHFLKADTAKNFYKSISKGTNVRRQKAEFRDFASGEFVIPPLPEQKKIAEILSGIDNSIKSLRLKKEKVKFAKSATSLHIFKSLKDSEQTATQVSDLQSLASIPISYGVLVPDNATREGGVPMIKIQDINQGKIQTEKLSYISRTLHDRYAKTEVKTGDLLISLIGSIGITARVPDVLEGANVSRQFAVIRTSSPAISDYLHCFLRGGVAQEKISFLSQGNAQKALNLDSLRGLEVPLKSNAEMDRIVRICQALDLIIESISRRIDKAEKIRLSVASDLLSGRKRVSI